MAAVPLSVVRLAVARTCVLRSAGADKARALSLLRVEVEEVVEVDEGAKADGVAVHLPRLSASSPSPSVPLRPFSLSLACRVLDWLNEVDPKAALHFSSAMHRSAFPLAAAFGGGSSVTPATATKDGDKEGEEGGEKGEGTAAVGNDTAIVNGTSH